MGSVRCTRYKVSEQTSSEASKLNYLAVSVTILNHFIMQSLTLDQLCVNWKTFLSSDYIHYYSGQTALYSWQPAPRSRYKLAGWSSGQCCLGSLVKWLWSLSVAAALLAPTLT